jgi:hypothetical protein
MDRQTAKSARRLVATDRSIARRTGSALARLLGVALLIVVIALTVVIATGKA